MLPLKEGSRYITLVNKEMRVSNYFYILAFSVVIRPLLPLILSNMRYRIVFSLLATLLTNIRVAKYITYLSLPSYLSVLYLLFKTILFLNPAILFAKNLISCKLLVVNLPSFSVFIPRKLSSIIY